MNVAPTWLVLGLMVGFFLGVGFVHVMAFAAHEMMENAQNKFEAAKIRYERGSKLLLEASEERRNAELAKLEVSIRVNEIKLEAVDEIIAYTNKKAKERNEQLSDADRVRS